MTAKLGINIDHVATIRRLRDTPYPDLIHAAHECIAGGADQITVHLREDRRHIQDQDVIRLKKEITVPLNLEMAATKEMLSFALQLKPHGICVVPEKREERTTEGGLDLSTQDLFLSEICRNARAAGILVSFFIEPTLTDVKTSRKLGAVAVELHTGALCRAWQSKAKEKNTEKYTEKYTEELEKVALAVKEAHKLSLLPHAGHGIDYEIIHELEKIDGIVEYNIGHSIIAESIFCGLRQATHKMKQVLKKKRVDINCL